MSLLDGKWIEVFRAGDYGAKGNYSAADLDALVSNYDPAKHEAPLVLGHPQHDAPAMGWVESLKRVGNVLMAKLRQVQPQLEDFVRTGMYTKRSISFYRDPLSLRHVGFLGAMPPEVQGLAEVKFRDGQFEQFEFNQEEAMEFTEMKKSFVEALKEFFGADKPESFSAAAVAKAVETATKSLQDNHNTLTKEFSDYQKAQSAAAAAAAAASASSSKGALAAAAIQGLKDAKRWIPAFDKMGLPQIFAELAKSELTIEFGEGDKKAKKSLLETFSEFLKSLGEIVPSGEIFKPAAEAKPVAVKFTETSTIKVDPESVAVLAAIRARASEKKISFGEALTQVTGERALTAKSGEV